MTIHHEGEPSYSQIPANKPRHIVFLDECLGGDVRGTGRRGLIHVARLSKFYIDTEPNKPVHVYVELIDPETEERHSYEGEGPTLGHACRAMLDRVNEDFPLGGEYELSPAA